MKTFFKIIVVFVFISNSVFPQTTSKQKLRAYIFLSEACPICQSYTLKLKELNERYSDNVTLIGVFPNYYSTEEDINEFKTKYSLSFELVKDINAKLKNEFKATVTPEAFLVDENGKLLYRGRIDNSFYEVGKRRNVITSNELEDAISAAIIKSKIKTVETKAVGCLISVSKLD